jgi:flagellar motor switch protein FliG
MSSNKPGAKKVDGLKMAAEILGTLKGAEREKLLANLLKSNPAMGQRIREQMMVLEEKERFKKNQK